MPAAGSQTVPIVCWRPDARDLHIDHSNLMTFDERAHLDTNRLPRFFQAWLAGCRQLAPFDADG